MTLPHDHQQQIEIENLKRIGFRSPRGTAMPSRQSTPDFTITTDPPPRTIASRIGVAVRTKQPQAEIDHLRGELAVANVRERARQELAKCPPLSDAQLARLRPLFAADDDLGGTVTP